MATGNSVLIFGAGAVGRGFLGRIVAANGLRPVFVEADKAVADQLRQTGTYTVCLVGRDAHRVLVNGFDVLAAGQEQTIAEAVNSCAFAATAVGGQNLPRVADMVKRGLAKREKVLNILVCENWPKADRVLEDALLKVGCSNDAFTCVSCSVERMARRETASLDVVAEGGIALYADANAWLGTRPNIEGFVFCGNIESYYARKLYTSNLGHAVLAYLGHLQGLKYVYEAMDLPQIRGELTGLFGLVREAFLACYDMKPADLDAHIEELLSWRYANRDLADTISRVARNPLRKLAPGERLAGVARMLERCGLQTQHISRVIAAAMHYRDADDPESVKLEKMIADKGPSAVLEWVCGFDEQGQIYKECLEAYDRLRSETQARRAK